MLSRFAAAPLAQCTIRRGSVPRRIALSVVTAEQTLVDQKMTAFGATLSFAARSGEGPFTHPLQTTSIVQCEAAAR